MPPVVVLASARTPFGAFQGSLAGIPAWALGAAAIRGCVRRAGLEPAAVDEVVMGCVLQAGLGQAPARRAALAAGLPVGVRATAVNRVCGSGLQAIRQAAHALAAGEAAVAVAGGMENMSQAPYLLPKAREGYRLGHQQAFDSVLSDGLWDPHHSLSMGECAERCAGKYGFGREEQDAYAVESFRRANDAQARGLLQAEITPVEDGAAEKDEVPGRVRYEKIPALKPAFRKDGTITAANASSLADGAAALVLALEGSPEAAGRPVLARIVSFGAHAQDPLWFTTAPVQAARCALDRAGWTADTVDLWEVNEAFAVVPMAFSREMGVGRERLNVRGGAISLGHPIGASAARIVGTLAAALRERGLRRGVAAVCIGGGEGLAACLEIP
jgi:acetyl-CoA C-acetyltransferase